MCRELQKQAALLAMARAGADGLSTVELALACGIDGTRLYSILRVLGVNHLVWEDEGRCGLMKTTVTEPAFDAVNHGREIVSLPLLTKQEYMETIKRAEKTRNKLKKA